MPRNSGQALIETTLVVFLLLAFAMGTLDFGQYLYFHQSLSERARAAARYGAVNPTDGIGIRNVAVYNDPAGASSGATPLAPNFSTTMVSVCLPGDQTCANPSAGPDSRVTVTISGYPMVTFNLFLPRSFTNQPITASLPSESPFS
jgi:Flp pilus assembly protein TadG